MSQSCSGPGCAFRYTYLAATALGAGVAMVAVPGGTGVTTFEGVLFALLVAVSANELRTGPVRLWWRTLAASSALSAVFGFVGVAAVTRFLSGEAYMLGFVTVVVGTMWVAPRLVELSPLVPAGASETAG